MSEPTPPEDVRLRTADGTEIPVECRYDGLINGLHRWTAVAPEGITMRRDMMLRVGMFPARTSIEMEFEP